MADPILLIGGSGIVGRFASQFLREAHPDAPLLIGGRDGGKAKEAADKLGNAEGVALDLGADDLGLGDRPVSAVATLFMDERLTGLRFAQSRGAGHISISPGINELAPEVAAFISRPKAASIVLGTEWMVGATMMVTLDLAKAFGRLTDIRVGALLDEEDAFGPAANADLERQTKTAPAALARRKGRYVWRVEEDAKATFRAIDGTEMEASALSPNDLLALAEATGAPNVEFNLAVGTSSSRRRGESMSHEIVIELDGEDHDGNPLRIRHAIVHPEGQMPLTGFGVAMVLERLAGLSGKRPEPGLYFPYQLIEPADYLARLIRMGGQVLDLGKTD